MSQGNQTENKGLKTGEEVRANSAAEAQQKRKKMMEDYKKQAAQNKKRWMPLVRFLKDKGLKIKTARCGKLRVQYFRTDQLQQIIQDNKQNIQKDAVLKDLKSHWQKQVVYFERPQNMPKLKYPQTLQKPQNNSKKKFASFKFDLAEPKTWLFPVILSGIIAVVLFPLWPYILKYTIFLICLYLVIAVVSLIVLRLVMYLLFAIFGVSFWLVPNFFADCTIVQSFTPIYSVQKWQTGTFSLIGRLLAFLILGYYSYHLYMDSSWVFQNIQITKTSLDDLHDWGVSKIKGEKNFSQSALTNLDDIMNQTADIQHEQGLNIEPAQFQGQNSDQQNAEQDYNQDSYQQNHYEGEQQYEQSLSAQETEL